MGEIKRKVQTIEVNFICDKCSHGMMEKSADINPKTGETPHKCMICGHEKIFKWITYPRIDYIGEDEIL
ncbi:MAG: transcription elongation factor Elf1 [Bermanella sp.]|jgi:transcription elongation factor Elf1